MVQEEQNVEQETPSSETLDAIAAFEGILEAVPDDVGALDVLVHTYQVVGDDAMAWEYLVRLVNVLIGQGQQAEAVMLADRVKELGADRPEKDELLRRIGSMPEAVANVHIETSTPLAMGGGAPSRSACMQSEMACAWGLKEADMLTEEEYASVVQDLTEISASESSLTVSVLHVLQDRAFLNTDRVMAFISRDTDVPIISATSFDTPTEVAELINHDFMVQNGVLVFEMVADEPLVVILNPYNEELRKHIEARLGKRCHFYLTLPSEFDAWIARATAKKKEEDASS